MFKRIIYDDWTGVIPIISFWLTFGVFIAICIRVLLLKQSRVDEMKNLPLENDRNSGIKDLNPASACASPHQMNASAKKTQVCTGER